MKFCLSVLFTLCFLALPLSASEGEHTEMENSMERMDEAYKDLRRALRSASAEEKAAYQELLATMVKEAKASRDMVPQMIAALPEAEQAAMQEDFQKDMDSLVAELERIGGLLEADDFDGAADALKGLRSFKSDGHKKFKEEE